MRIGMIGLGNMGCPMARRLIEAGRTVMVHDVYQPAADELLAAGVLWADSPESLAAQCDVIFTSLPGPTEAEAVVLGVHGIAAGARPGTVYVDLTTNSPVLVRRCAAALAERGVAMLDAPLSGGVEAAAKGALTMLIGGDPAVLERVRPVLELLAQTIVHVGPIGTASIAKLLHNCAVFGANLAMIECLTVGVRAGLDTETLVKIFQQSGLGRNLDLQVAMPATLFRGNFQPRYAMKTAYKDMRLALDLAEECQVPVALATLCAADMATAIERGWANLDNTSFLRLQEERAGAEVRTAPAGKGKRGTA